MATPTHFTHPCAVDVWDAQFRWRSGELLCDRTIDATWARVAKAATGASDVRADSWARRYIDAFSEWRLLPDERLLRRAGTSTSIGRFERPVAALNAGAFVLQPRSAQARFDHTRFVATASLAVRLLDDVLVQQRTRLTRPEPLRIGMLGLADALAAMGLCYDSDRARAEARAIAESLARGSLDGSLELARERGPLVSRLPARWAETQRRRGTPADLVASASQHGLRHARLTAIDSLPMLSRLANDASDAIDPRFDDPGIDRSLAACAAHAFSCRGVAAQIAMRAAVRPMIDAPIDYPFVLATTPTDAGIADLQHLAAESAFDKVTFRVLDPARPQPLPHRGLP